MQRGKKQSEAVPAGQRSLAPFKVMDVLRTGRPQVSGAKCDGLQRPLPAAQLLLHSIHHRAHLRDGFP